MVGWSVSGGDEFPVPGDTQAVTAGSLGQDDGEAF